MSKIIFIVTVTLTFDPKINRVLPLPQGNHVAKFVKDTIYRTKVIVRKRPLSKILFIAMVTLTSDPKINKVLSLPRGNHVAKFGKDPIYRTKVIVHKPVWTPARHTQSHNTDRLKTGVYKKRCNLREYSCMIQKQQPALSCRDPVFYII